MEKNSDFLRSPEHVCEPDERNAYFTKTIEDHHSDVAKLQLHNEVPREVWIQFETTKNIYLYAWFVYRFYPVAKLHAYTCLEFALRERFEPELILLEKKEQDRWKMLKGLLSYAASKGYLRNENFEDWRNQTMNSARERTEMEAITEMDRLGLDELVFDDSNIEIKDVDRDEEYLSTQIKTIPSLRNHYAHGNKTLDNQVLGTLRRVSEIINQIFPG